MPHAQLFAVDELEEPTGALNFICEIPKWTNKKYEVATKEEGNPIKQDEKKGQLRTFKKGDIYFNYGCFPRTWEDPDFVHPDAGVGGDNDPLDVCEIGLRQIGVGETRQVKVLGVLCMIDDGEADWKISVIYVNDRWASELNDVEDVEHLLPGTISAVREWFRTYKIPDGKPPNVFGLGERCMPRAYAMNVIHETHRAWEHLLRSTDEASVSTGMGMKRKELSHPKLSDLGGDMSIRADLQSAKKLSSEDLSKMCSKSIIA